MMFHYISGPENGEWVTGPDELQCVGIAIDPHQAIAPVVFDALEMGVTYSIYERIGNLLVFRGIGQAHGHEDGA